MRTCKAFHKNYIILTEFFSTHKTPPKVQKKFKIVHKKFKMVHKKFRIVQKKFRIVHREFIEVQNFICYIICRVLNRVRLSTIIRMLYYQCFGSFTIYPKQDSVKMNSKYVCCSFIRKLCYISQICTS